MAKPWEKYQKKEDGGKPWDRYAKAESEKIPKAYAGDKGAQDAFIGGLRSGASLGYLRPDNFEELKGASPIAYGAGEITAGALNPIMRILGPGRTLLKGIAGGAAAGAAYKPEGEDSLEARATQAGVGAGAGGILGALSGAGKELAGQYDAYKRIINPEGLSRELKSKIDEVIQAARSNYIAPRAQEVKQLASQGSVELGPAQVSKISDLLPQYGKTIGKKLNPNELGQPRVEIEGQRALKLRKVMDDLADFKKQRALSEDSIAKSDAARAVADVLRQRVGEINPRIPELQKESAQAIRTIGEIQGKSVSPQSILGKDTGDVASLIADLERYAGTDDLRKMGDYLRGGYSMTRTNPLSLVRPLQSGAEIVKYGKRGAGAVSSMLESMPAEPRNAILLQILNSLPEK